MAIVAEMVGFRRIFQLGIVVFTLGSLGCTIAHSLPMLALSRAIQGFGAAGIMSQNGALVRFTCPSLPLCRRWVAKLCRRANGRSHACRSGLATSLRDTPIEERRR